jgi:CubicO group peptidase (beta-lactamase class C family)
MGWFIKAIKWIGALLAILILAVFAWIGIAPPELLRVGTAYSAKIVCSNVFIAGRDAKEVLAVDVQAPGHPLLRTVSVSVDEGTKTVRARMFGYAAESVAVAREGLGCAVAPDGDVKSAGAFAAAPAAAVMDAASLWPDGEAVQLSQDPAIAAILDDPAMTGPGMRAVVVVKNGRIVAERYGEGFVPQVPLLGWSMTKTVNAALAGTATKDGTLMIDQKGLLPAMEGGRETITVADLMGMASGLSWNEGYGDVSDVTRMLYLEPDMAGFASRSPLVAAGAAGIGKTFNYSSGTSVMLARIWQGAVGGGQAALDWPRAKLFGPLGMKSATFEVDARGTFVGSSYLYATARDWARFGQFMLQKGVWNRQEILPAGFADWMMQPHPASITKWGRPEYGQGQIWLRGPDAGTPEGEDPDKGYDLPADTVWMLGHDGQAIAIVPSKGLVMVRMGLTPSKLGYKPQKMLQALIAATGG